jgi:hypothetical protein
MKNNVAKKMRKKGVGKKVTCPQVLVVCMVYLVNSGGYYTYRIF